MTYVLSQTPALVAEFQVRYTGLDTLGGERMVTLPGTDLGEAVVECDRIRTHQENYRLPVDARVWVRVGDGAWRVWVGDVTRGCEMAGCDQRGAEPMSACGITYVCPSCRQQIEELTAIYMEEDAAEAARLAVKAGAATA